MGEATRDTITLATGPYDVNTKNSSLMAEKIRYRHYKPDELQIAKAFIRKPYIVGQYFFDYYLLTDAAMRIIEIEVPPKLADIVPWMQRIDAVLFKGKKVFIIEFKDRLRASGIGELLTYRELWEKQYGFGREVELIYVYRDEDPTFHRVLERHKIQNIRILPEEIKND